ncbi:hypothetical protein FA15DRAFT_674616 [Coprinopsis marcescibilis]|uniref:Uncharacterized protein n=1 Tax=Coprinopsis marcescibilis TaxID=230819 RepID=A0A5C3KGZ7_COPMA|nr:hypothetical protein FA15DRAFT_674616 [Coprinopsis marcescibilis]
MRLLGVSEFRDEKRRKTYRAPRFLNFFLSDMDFATVTPSIFVLLVFKSLAVTSRDFGPLYDC